MVPTARAGSDHPQVGDLPILVRSEFEARRLSKQSGYLPFLNLDYVFRQLHEGLGHNRLRLGEERYLELLRLSDRMRALFEADPEDKTGETSVGCKIIHEMEDILREARRKSCRRLQAGEGRRSSKEAMKNTYVQP
jgi:hypothetical protein